MDTGQLARYAPSARREFAEAVAAQAALLGVTASGCEPAAVSGDVLLVGGRAFPSSVQVPRSQLVDRVSEFGFDHVVQQVAYTWFNRLAAIRYMELHGYLDHGYRVLSHPDGGTRPEILEHATDVGLPGLDPDVVVELKLDGGKDEELYRQLLLAQCHGLHKAMPFLFDRIGGVTELLMPANLLHTDSLIRRLVEEVDESAWDQIEVIGWLYQFYISEKKEQVIGKVVKSEDIPAATQLFTPNWIVKYMVQNSLGAQWLATYPDSPLKGQMEYYIEPAEQTDEVNAQLAAITPSQLNPEELTLIDPASGSGHILVEAYDLFKAIYLERGYRQRDVAQLILEKNLYGLDIDERAAQLTGFALMMKGRADDRQLFERGVKLNVMALVDSTGFDAEALAKGVKPGEYGLTPGDLTELKRLFEHATTFGSLIQIPEGLAEKLPELKQLSEATSHDLFVSEALKRLGPLVCQVELLAAHYDAVVANPPYMGSKYQTSLLKKFTGDNYSDAKSDLFASFIERSYTLAKRTGHGAMVTMQSWMFLSSFEKMRERLLRERTIASMAHLGPRGFAHSSALIVQTVAFVLANRPPRGYVPAFFRLLEGGEADKGRALAEGQCRFNDTTQEELGRIPGSPIAYWVPESIRDAFRTGISVGRLANPRLGMATGDNDQHIRLWQEVDTSRTYLGALSRGKAKASGLKWFPYNKGGGFRRWYGNRQYVVNWENDGHLLQTALDPTGSRIRAHNFNLEYIFKPSLTWSATSEAFSIRFSGSGFLFDVKGSSCFPDTGDILVSLGFLASSLTQYLMGALNPTIEFQPGNVASLPFWQEGIESRREAVEASVSQAIGIAQWDWDAYERSWDFQSLPILTASAEPTPTLESSYTAWITENRDTIAEMKRLEEENNRLFIDAYGLGDELTPEVPIEQITLTVNPAYRYGGKLTEEELWTRFRQDSMEELVSYAVGCMMGRYSLDEPGLVYANSGNVGFDPSRYGSFPADGDGIVPLTDTQWFVDDAANRLVEFVSVAFDSSHLEENLTFIADNLSPRKGESSRETVRRYLRDGFFTDHVQTYKKRPIYWLFSSGKQKAFQCLVYLHRYNEGTLARMRSEYVIPLQGKVAAQLERLTGDISAATSTAHRRRLEKEQDRLLKQQVELVGFDEKLRHYADQRISLDLDDGVKVNYGKFGDLLADVKDIHGKKADTL